MNLYNIAKRISSSDPKIYGKMMAYKRLEETEKSITRIPGYCMVDLGHQKNDSLYYIKMFGLEIPFYWFEISGLIESPFSDIVGYNINSANPEKIKKIKESMTNEQIYEALLKIEQNKSQDQDIEYTFGLIRAIEPGIVKTSSGGAGFIGEAIINIPLTINLLDGEMLVNIIQKADLPMTEVFDQIRNNGADYDWPELLKALQVNYRLYEYDERKWNWNKIRDEIEYNWG